MARRRKSHSLLYYWFIVICVISFVYTILLLILTPLNVIMKSLNTIITDRVIFIAKMIGITLIALPILWKLYEILYFHGKHFRAIKDRIQAYVDNCNALNEHIEELKHTHLGLDQTDYGQSVYYDNSRYNYKRSAMQNYQYAANIYHCSRSVCANARQQPYKYLCKYFNLPATEETLSNVEEVLNNFEAAETGSLLLTREKSNIFTSIKKDVPFLIRTFSKKKLEKKLGFYPIDLNTPYFPRYSFQYISAGGNASMGCDIVMDIDALNSFINYLSQIVKFKKSAAGQRALMTSRLRQYILKRDGYTCKYCGASLEEEPNLLLEIDHITPISKGGLTTEDNLQTLCWRCNRSKGAKTI